MAAEWLAVPAAQRGRHVWRRPASPHAVGSRGSARPLSRRMSTAATRTRRTFADEMSARLDIDVVPVDRPQEAAEDLPIVVTATHQHRPRSSTACLAEGTLVCAVATTGPPGPRSTPTSSAGPTTSSATASKPAGRGRRFCRRAGEGRLRLVAGRRLADVVTGNRWAAAPQRASCCSNRSGWRSKTWPWEESCWTWPGLPAWGGSCRFEAKGIRDSGRGWGDREIRARRSVASRNCVIPRNATSQSASSHWPVGRAGYSLRQLIVLPNRSARELHSLFARRF